MTHTDWNTEAAGPQPGPQPGQPAWQPPQQPFQQPFQPQPEQAGRGRKLLKIGGPIAGAVVVGVASLTGFFGAGDPEIGDCVKATGSDTWDVVDCGSDEAQWKVIGEDEKQITYPEFQKSSEICSAFPTAEYSLWIGPDGSQGTVYCAEPVS